MNQAAGTAVQGGASTAQQSRSPGGVVTVYGCDQEELVLFQQVARRRGLALRATDEALNAATLDLAIGSRCISVNHKAPVGNELLRDLAEAGVEYISTRSAGSDHIDVEFARSIGITVEGVAYSPDSVADYTLMLILMTARGARATVLGSEAHDFRLSEVRGKELRDLTVGVVGTGRIGAAVIDRLQGFGCRVLAHDRTAKTSAQYVDLDSLLARSDVVTLHTPLKTDTRYLLNRRRIERMRHGAIVVNTGRGALINTQALLAALEAGKLSGAALDVLEGEEHVLSTHRSAVALDSALVTRFQRLPNVLITPHTAFYTEHALLDIVHNTIRNCSRYGEPSHE